MISPVFIKEEDGECEMRLFLYLFGQDIGSLGISLRTSLDGDKISLGNWTTSNGDYWQSAVLKISINQPFQVLIEGVVGNGKQSSIAFDDISFNNYCVKDDKTVLPTNNPLTSGSTSNSISDSPTTAAATTISSNSDTTQKTTSFKVSESSNKPVTTKIVTEATVSNACPVNNCQNGGRCMKISEKKTKCQCQPEYTGEKCETKLGSQKNNGKLKSFKIDLANFYNHLILNCLQKQGLFLV